jgi:NAD(P)H-hydrate epimerase
MIDFRLASQEQMRRLDAEAGARPGQDAGILMERAARAACHLVLEQTIPGDAVGIVAGSGNNGADGLLLAALLAGAGRRVEVVQVAGRSGNGSALWRVQAARLAAAGVAVQPWPGPDGEGATRLKAALSACVLLVDALCGAGLAGPLEGPAAEAVAWMNRLNHTSILALDLPSGLHDRWRPGQPALRASQTLCFGLAKLCLYLPAARSLAGRIMVAGIGMTDGADTDWPRLMADDELPGLAPPVSVDIHKYQRGSVAILAGSDEYPGALELALRGALGSRAGMVHALAEPAVFGRLPGVPPEILRHGLAENAALAENLPRRLDAAAAGPGWGRSGQRAARLAELLSESRRRGFPVVLDADALHALAGLSPRPHAGLVLTPHLAELAALSGQPADGIAADPRPCLAELAERWGAVVHLKGPVAWIVSPEGGFWVYDGANPLLAQAGSGDVLTGITVAALAALVAAGVPNRTACLQAARLGCLCLARAGRTLGRAQGWAGSSALAGILPSVWSEISPVPLRGTEFIREAP